MIESRGLQTRLHVDSCATASFHIGKPPDPRSVAAAARRGYGVPARPARQITDADAIEGIVAHVVEANLQQVEVRQGPLQRLLGIADVRVQSAGGGGDSEHKSKGQDSMHHAIFHGVTNAGEIRDLILARLKRFREAGLGDPDDSAPLAENNTALAAAQELLAEVRTLRQTFRP